MLKKKIATIVVVVTLFGAMTAFAATELPAPVKGQMMIPVIVNGQKVKFPDTEPFINEDGRTMVPVRFVSEKLGATVSWDAANQIVGIKYGAKEIAMPLGSNIVKVDGAEVTLDTTATLTEGRTMVPLRFVSEVLSSTVLWDKDANSVQVSDAAFLAKVADGTIKLDPWGRQISDKVSDTWNMLTDIPDLFYTIKTSNLAQGPGNDNNKDFFKYVPQWTSKKSIDEWSNRIKRYYTSILNVDYRTIDEALFIKSIEDNMQIGSDYYKEVITESAKGYVKFVKDNHVVAKGYADPESFLVRYEKGDPIMRTYFKFIVLQSDNKTQTFFDSYDLSYASEKVQLKFNVMYTGYADVTLSTNYGNNQQDHFSVSGGEHMFVKGHYSYLEVKK